MTGPSSWRHLHDVHSERSEAWSELLGLRCNPRTSPGTSRTGGLFASPNLPPSSATSGRHLRELLPEQAESTRIGQARDSPGNLWVPSAVEARGRMSLDSVFASMPVSYSEKEPLRPTQGLRDVDPLFPTPESTGATSAPGLRALDQALPTTMDEPRGTGHVSGQGFRGLAPLLEAVATGSAAFGNGARSPREITTRRSLPREQRQKPLGTLSPSTSHPLLCRDSYARKGLSPVSSHSALASEAMGKASEGLSPVMSEAIIQHEEYRRAALDFVLELAGPQVPASLCRHGDPKSELIKPDELPIPAFAVDRDALVCVWNKQLALLSGWEEEDVMRGSMPLSCIFQADGKMRTRNKGCLELMRSVLFGMASPESSRFLLRRRGGNLGRSVRGLALQDSPGPFEVASARPPRKSRSKSMGEAPQSNQSLCVPVELRFSRKTDSVGGVVGVICVVVPVKEAPLQPCEGCRIGASKSSDVSLGSSDCDLMQEKAPDKTSSVLPQCGVIFEQGPSSTSSSRSGSSDIIPAPTSMPTLLTPDSLAVEKFQTSVPVSASPLGSEGAPSVRALVMESVDAVRMELTQNLERCGVDVVSCGSLGEAMWRFEHSLSDPSEGPRFDIIFLELEPHTDELYLGIRDLRRLEVEAKLMGQVPTLDAVRCCRHGSSSARPQIMDTASLLANSDNSRVRDSEDEHSTVNEVASPSQLKEGLPGETEGGPDSVLVPREASPPLSTAQEPEKRCLILAMVNLNRWDLAGLDVAMEQCVRAGGDAVIPRSMPLQQLKTALRKLGIRSKYLMFPSRLPRALSGNLHNPLNLSR